MSIKQPEQRPNWVEQHGEVIPSYTGPNAPVYPNKNEQELQQELGEIHEPPVIAREMGPNEVIDAIHTQRADMGIESLPPVNSAENALPKFIENRHRVLGK